MPTGTSVSFPEAACQARNRFRGRATEVTQGPDVSRAARVGLPLEHLRGCVVGRPAHLPPQHGAVIAVALSKRSSACAACAADTRISNFSTT